MDPTRVGCWGVGGGGHLSAPLSPFLSSEGHGTSSSTPLPQGSYEPQGGRSVRLGGAAAGAGTGVGSVCGHRCEGLSPAPKGPGPVSVDGPGLTLMSGEGRGDVAQGPAGAGKARRAGAEGRAQAQCTCGQRPGVSERLRGNTADASVGLT